MNAEERRLAALTPDEFRKVVDSDIRGMSSPETAKALRSEPIRQRWYTTLMLMQKSVEGQLAAKAAEMHGNELDFNRRAEKWVSREDSSRVGYDGWLKEMEAYERWKASIYRFKNGLEMSILDAKGVVSSTDDSGSRLVYLEDERNRALVRVAELETAIRRHRDSFPTEDDPSEADDELWKHIEGRI